MADTTREQALDALQELEYWAKGNRVILQGEHYKALGVAIAALRGPQPDPETGLVPCGCGCPANVVTWYIGDEIDECVKEEPQQYGVCCSGGCPATTAWEDDLETVKAQWNKMMGWRADNG